MQKTVGLELESQAQKCTDFANIFSMKWYPIYTTKAASNILSAPMDAKSSRSISYPTSLQARKDIWTSMMLPFLSNFI